MKNPQDSNIPFCRLKKNKEEREKKDKHETEDENQSRERIFLFQAELSPKKLTTGTLLFCFLQALHGSN